MRPLSGREPPRLRRYALDVEATGLGTAVDPKTDAAIPPEVLVAVLYDGRRFRRFWGPEGLKRALAWVASRGEDAEVWAHYGGGYDYRLAFEWLWADRASRWQMTTVGSSVLSCVGRLQGAKLRLVDSIRLLAHTSIAKLGKAVDLPKLFTDYEHRPGGCPRGKECPACLSLTPRGRVKLAEGCERDTEILWLGLSEVEKFASAEGVSMRSTIASTATASIRKNLTNDTVAYAPEGIEQICERACVAGRVEPFSSECGPALVYDFQSSYPRAMTYPLPWRYVGTRRDYEPGDGSGPSGVVEATVTVPDCYLPVLPHKQMTGPDKGKLFFPTGTFSGTWASVELDYAVEQGLARIDRVQAFHEFETSTVLRSFARKTWRERFVHPDGSFLRYFWKIWGNSSYGKTIEGLLKEEIVVWPDRIVCRRHREGLLALAEKYVGEPQRIRRAWREYLEREADRKKPCGCVAPVVPSAGLFSRQFEREPAFRAPQAGAAILAIARVRLHREILSPVLDTGGAPHYTDTDNGVISGTTLPTGPDLGDLALERRIDSGRFLAPKLYEYRCLECSKEKIHPHWVVKGKGFPRMTHEEFASLSTCGCAEGHRPGSALGCPRCGGGALGERGTGRAVIKFERTEGIKEALARGRTDFRRILVERGFRDVSRPKRADGGARPWSVGELARKYVPPRRIQQKSAA